MIISEKEQKITKAEDIAKIMIEILNSEHEIDQKKEHFWSIGLSSNNNIEYIELISLGGLDFCSVHARETFRFAVMKAVKSIVICHNHPSNNLKVSSEDLGITKKLKKSGEILGIKIIDHIIISKNDWMSFLSTGIF